MSDVMLFGVLRMPYEMAMGNELSRRQFWQRAQEATDRLEAAERTPANPAPASTGRVKIPVTADEAAGMALVGMAWLKEHAPERLVQPIAARELDVEAERREPPTLPRYLLDMIGEYGMARTDSVGQLEVQHRWETLIGGIKRYASDFASTAQGTQADSAPVSTEQAGDAREQVQHVTWMVGRRVGRTHALAQQIIDNLSDEAKARTSYGNIRDVLDTVHKMSRAPSSNNSPVGADSGKDQ